MAKECPTGILLDFSEPIQLSPTVYGLVIGSNNDPGARKQFGYHCATDNDRFGSPSTEDVLNKSDCDFIENETLSDLSACSTQSSSNSGDEVMPIVWSPGPSKRTPRRTFKDGLSIGQRVEVFKEATCIAMHLENLSRGTPPPKPMKNMFTSPLLEKSADNTMVSNSNTNLERYFDFDKSSKAGTENQRPETEAVNPISFRPPMYPKPEARVQPILKSKIKENEHSSEAFSTTLRVNKSKAIVAMTTSRQFGPVKVKKSSPMKQPIKLQRVVAKVNSFSSAKKKSPLANSKSVSSTYTPINARSSIDKRIATVSRSSSFGAESSRIRPQSAVLSASFSVSKPPIRSQTPDKTLYRPQSSKDNSKSVRRSSFGSVCSTPVQPKGTECRSFVESSTLKRSVIPTLRLTPQKAATVTPFTRNTSTSGNIPKKNLLPTKHRVSAGGNSPKKTVLPTSKLLATRFNSSVHK